MRVATNSGLPSTPHLSSGSAACSRICSAENSCHMRMQDGRALFAPVAPPHRLGRRPAELVHETLPASFTRGQPREPGSRRSLKPCRDPTRLFVSTPTARRCITASRCRTSRNVIFKHIVFRASSYKHEKAVIMMISVPMLNCAIFACVNLRDGATSKRS